ncbi:hypothetical protein VAZ01S_016_00750 [Vibrio azureus NBRC 104587]|uniref:Uncharacterized protein n=1 Tax=Vibrio azureus NBRC 104587 TaxID=1219077 RepID=U3AM96_9VIBR|nr:hypothetical protein VAZ01S_016_00750 [Vibrio azureus NBRC 104587]
MQIKDFYLHTTFFVSKPNYLSDDTTKRLFKTDFEHLTIKHMDKYGLKVTYYAFSTIDQNH